MAHVDFVKQRFYRMVDGGCLCNPENRIGYCWSISHPGFLSKRLVKEHQCVEKNCVNLERFERPFWDNIVKPKTTNKSKKKTNFEKKILNLFRAFTVDIEEFAVCSVYREKDCWVVQYIALDSVDLYMPLMRLRKYIRAKIRLKPIKAPYKKRKEIIEKVRGEYPSEFDIDI